MKTIKEKILFAIVFIFSLSSFCGCQKEEEMEDNILSGVCWEGQLPVSANYGQKNYFSRYFFYEDNGYKHGLEESYYKGQWDQNYEFGWYWLEGHYSVIALNYGGRWGDDIAILDINKVTHNYIYGYYYTSLAEYEAYKAGDTSIRGQNVELHHVDVGPHQENIQE